MIELTNVHYTYNGTAVLDGINLNIENGSFTAILGRNGSGKSTLAKLLNAILIPNSGIVRVDGIDTRDTGSVFDVRERVGMVFQNPEAQAVASIVEDDTAFGPENLGLSPEETEKRVVFALEAVGIAQLRNKAISTLSGGQKQLVAIAGIIAMQPRYIIFDEATAMLDPLARNRVLDCAMKLRRELGVTIIWITHYMEEAALADKIIILDKGKIVSEGTPEETFSRPGLIDRTGLDMPQSVKLSIMLIESGVPIERIALTPAELADMLSGIQGGKKPC